MHKFTSLTVEPTNPDFLSDLATLNITAVRVASDDSFPEFEYQGSENSLKALIDLWFGNDDSLLESIEVL